MLLLFYWAVVFVWVSVCCFIFQLVRHFCTMLCSVRLAHWLLCVVLSIALCWGWLSCCGVVCCFVVVAVVFIVCIWGCFLLVAHVVLVRCVWICFVVAVVVVIKSEKEEKVDGGQARGECLWRMRAIQSPQKNTTTTIEVHVMMAENDDPNEGCYSSLYVRSFCFWRSVIYGRKYFLRFFCCCWHLLCSIVYTHWHSASSWRNEFAFVVCFLFFFYLFFFLVGRNSMLDAVENDGAFYALCFVWCVLLFWEYVELGMFIWTHQIQINA